MKNHHQVPGALVVRENVLIINIIWSMPYRQIVIQGQIAMGMLLPRAGRRISHVKEKAWKALWPSGGNVHGRQAEITRRLVTRVQRAQQRHESKEAATGYILCLSGSVLGRDTDRT